MKRLIVLIDGGWLKYSTRFVAAKRIGASYDTPKSELAKNAKFLAANYDVMATSLRSKLGAIETNFAKIDRCIVCKDVGDSWRTKVEKTLIPGTEQASSIDYKGHRRTDDPDELAAIVQLNRIYDKCLNVICDNSGIECVYKPTYEADDFMIVLSKAYADQGDTVLIMAQDADITQAVYTSASGGHVIVMQPQHDNTMRMVVDHATHDSTSKVSIFSMSEWPIGLASAINNAQVLAPQYMLFMKILNGDASDDISPVMSRVHNGRTYKLTTKQFDAITAYFAEHNPEGYFKIENLYDDNDIHTILCMVHQAVHKQNFEDLPADWQKFYYDKFVENRKMVVVNKAELGPIYNDVLKTAVSQLHGITPTIAFPSWQVLQQLGV
jgi:hypothetical protein